VRARVVAARARQTARYCRHGIATNAELTPGLMNDYCATDRAALRVLQAAMKKLSLSARGYDRVRKVARTNRRSRRRRAPCAPIIWPKRCSSGW